MGCAAIYHSHRTDNYRMKMEKKFVRRRRVVAFIVVGIPLLIAAYYLVNHVWWTGTGYCWGDSVKCLGM